MYSHQRCIFLSRIQVRGHGNVRHLGVRSAGPLRPQGIDREIPVRLQARFSAGNQPVADHGDAAVHIIRHQRGRQFQRLAEIAAVPVNHAVNLPDSALGKQGAFHGRVPAEHDHTGFPVAGRLQRPAGQRQRLLLRHGSRYVHHQPRGPVRAGRQQAQAR